MSNFTFWVKAMRAQQRDLGSILFKRAALAACVVTACVGCGQKGALYLPNDPAARDRASLPEVLMPNWPGSTPGTTPQTAPNTAPNPEAPRQP